MYYGQWISQKQKIYYIRESKKYIVKEEVNGYLSKFQTNS